jgi:hypothetical protein
MRYINISRLVAGVRMGPTQVAYASATDTIAAAVPKRMSVMLVAYVSGALIRSVFLNYMPRAVAFAANGTHILVTTSGEVPRLSKFDVDTGEVVASSDIPGAREGRPSEVLVMADGSIVVGHDTRRGVDLVCVDGALTTWTTWTTWTTMHVVGDFRIVAVSALGRIRVKKTKQCISTFHDVIPEWYDSLRCAWITACARASNDF